MRLAFTMARDPIDIPFDVHELILDHIWLPPSQVMDWYASDSREVAENRATLHTYSMVSCSSCIAANSSRFASISMHLKFFSRISILRVIYHIRSFALNMQMDFPPARADQFAQAGDLHHLIDLLHGPTRGVECLAVNIVSYRRKFEYTKINNDLRRSFHSIFRSPKLE
ncbi:hypothetical protein BDN70DRAFT_572181 [Pholiota conissans]|uniref:Uncharacterized protein n=1 Tax=Pholiota conissans TaxID=109636 RepID=A0A9P6D220_9AGAR|nr:hypothetical protein BDN70DRAFT_572181 [Pholiota conissans]